VLARLTDRLLCVRQIPGYGCRRSLLTPVPALVTGRPGLGCLGGSRQQVEERRRPVGNLASSVVADSWFGIGDLKMGADAG